MQIKIAACTKEQGEINLEIKKVFLKKLLYTKKRKEKIIKNIKDQPSKEKVKRVAAYSRYFSKSEQI